MLDEQYKVIFDAISCPILVLNADLKIVDRNSAASMLGLPASIGKDIQNVISLSTHEMDEINDPSVMETCLTQKVPKGRGDHWYDIHVKKVTFSPGNVIHLIVLFHDITEIKKAETAIQHDQRLFLSIIEFLPDPTFVIDIHGKVLAWNKALAELTNIPAVEILGKGDYEYAVPFYGSRRPMLIDYILKKIDQPALHYPNYHMEGDSISAEVYLSSLREEGIHLWAKATTLKNAGGELIGAVETIRDITELKKSQDQLQFLSTHDPVTGLFNRLYFDTEVNRLLKSRRYPISILLYDLRTLKRFNDQRKYPLDDQKIRDASEILKNSFRQEDMVARLGAHEFAIIMPSSDLSTGRKAVQRIIQAVVKYNQTRPKSSSLLLAVGLSSANEPSILHRAIETARANILNAQIP
jgi:diguanylate cyclase (GGDEF)-like protein/PAS domain S-box-containing protein